MKKRLLALLTSIIFILSTCSICFAETTEKPPVNPLLELSQLQISSQITLYNSSDDYCATYFKLKNGGYVIFDSYEWIQPQSTTPYAQFVEINDGWGSIPLCMD